MESQNISFNDFKDLLVRQFVKLDAEKKRKFLKYLVTMPDLLEKKDIENYVNKIYLNDDDKGEKGAEDLLKMVLTLSKDHKITFVEYLTSQLDDEDSNFVVSLLVSENIDEKVKMDALYKGNKNDGSEINLNVIENETSDVTLNELSDHKADNDTQEVMVLERSVENENVFEGDLENLFKQLFQLEKASRWKFLKYLLMVPDSEEKEEIQSFLDSVYLSNNEGDNIAEHLLKIVVNLEKSKKATFVKHLLRRLGDEDAAFISRLMAPYREAEEHVYHDMELEETEEGIDSLLNKEAEDNKVVEEDIIDTKADGFTRSPDYKKCFESDDLLIEMRPTAPRVVNTKNEFENTNKNYENANLDPKEIEEGIDSVLNNVAVGKEIMDTKEDGFPKGPDYKKCFESDNLLIKMIPTGPKVVNIKNEYLKLYNRAEEDSKYFENDSLKIKLKERLPLNKSNEIGAKSKDNKSNTNYKKRMNSKNRKRNISKRWSKEVLKPCPKNIFKCEKCCVGTETEETLQEHMRVSHYKKEGDETLSKSKICDICSKQFKYPSFLRTHIKNVHSTERHFLCNYCSKVFKAQANLTQHINGTHTKKYALKCEICNKSFNCKRNLQRHEFVHTESKHLSCERCPKLFHSNYALESHMKYHDGKVYTCNQCNKDFSSFSNFKTHERLHNGEKPYICDVCQKAFAQKGNLITHKSKCKSSHKV